MFNVSWKRMASLVAASIGCSVAARPIYADTPALSVTSCQRTAGANGESVSSDTPDAAGGPSFSGGKTVSHYGQDGGWDGVGSGYISSSVSDSHFSCQCQGSSRGHSAGTASATATFVSNGNFAAYVSINGYTEYAAVGAGEQITGQEITHVHWEVDGDGEEVFGTDLDQSDSASQRVLIHFHKGMSYTFTIQAITSSDWNDGNVAANASMSFDLQPGNVSIPGDLNNDGTVDQTDIDLENNPATAVDLNGDGVVDDNDVMYLFGTILDCYPGDLNLDGAVTIADFNIMSANFGKAGGYAQGDIDGDGYVTIADFNIMSQYFDMGRPN